MRFLIAFALLATLTAVRPASAQANNYGLTISTNGSTAGQSCNTGSCMLDAIGTRANMQVDATVWGNPGSLYLLAVSAQGLVCQAVPGVINLYMLDNNPELVAFGQIPPGGLQPQACASPQNAAVNTLTIPPWASSLVFRFQAVAVGGAPTSRLAFTGAIDMTVF